MIVRELLTKIGFKVEDSQLRKAEAGINNFNSGLGNLRTHVASAIPGIGQLAALASTAFATYGGFQLAKGIVEITSRVEDLKTSFEVLTGSAGMADTVVARLRKQGAETPFEFQDLADATKTLLQFQVPLEETSDKMMQLGDISMGNKDRFQRLTYAFGQISSAGKLQGQDLLQMINAGWNPLNTIIERTGETTQQVRKRMEKGAISAYEVALAMKKVTSEGGLFFKGMEKGSKTLGGLWSTLLDNIDEVKLAVGMALLPAMKEVVGSSIKWFQSLIPIFQSWSDNYIPSIIDAVKSLWWSIRQGVKESGVIQAITDLFEELTGRTFDGKNKMLAWIPVIQALVKDLGTIIKVVVDLIKGLVSLNNYTNGWLGSLALLSVELFGVYKVIQGFLVLRTAIVGFFIATGAGATTAASGMTLLATALGPVTVAILAAVAAYKVLSWWVDKVEKDLDERGQNANKGNLAQYSIDEAKARVQLELDTAKEIKAIRDRNAKGQIGRTQANDDFARLQAIEKELGLKEGTFAKKLETGFRGKGGGLTGQVIFNNDVMGQNELRALESAGSRLKLRLKNEQDKAVKDKSVTNINTTNEVKFDFNVDPDTSKNQAKSIADKTRDAMMQAFEMQMSRVLITTV